jgi:periodic tryptophan protein 2
MTEWGNVNLVEQGEGASVALPGVRKGDLSSRHFHPEVQVAGVNFSPTGDFKSLLITHY